MKFEGDVLLSAGELITTFSPAHHLHSGQVEILGQQLMPSFESPDRSSMILRALEDHRLVDLKAQRRAVIDLGLAHDRDYIQALQGICRDLEANDGAILPSNWAGGKPRARPSHPLSVRLGDWSRDTYTSVGQGTFTAAASSAGSVVAALDELLTRGKGGAFSLGRPPHHHAGHAYMGGYCYINGVALAAMRCKMAGLRVAVVDVDYHHGNGTQDILYQADALYCSVHGDPASAFPYFLGFADEVGKGEGEGFNLNIPMPAGTDWSAYSKALAHIVERVRAHGADVLIVSLGVDTFAGDPLGQFALAEEDFARVGHLLSQLGVPTLFVMEGGYAVCEIGLNVARVLEGFLG